MGFGAHVLGGPFRDFRDVLFFTRPKIAIIQEIKVHLQTGPQHANALSYLSESLNKNKNTSNQTNEPEMTSVLTVLEYFEVFLAYF